MKKLFLINMLLLTLLLQNLFAKELKYLPGSYLDTVSAHDAETGLAIMDPVNLTQSVNGINVIRFTYISDSRFINRQYFVIKILDDNNNCTMTVNSC